MRLKNFCLSLGLALAAASPGAEAADWNSSIKDRGGIPVPAPIPVVETFKWYLRADVGAGLVSSIDASTNGDIYGFDRDPLDGLPFGVQSAWFNNNFETFAMGGVGVGAYFSPRFRGDITVDVRTKSNLDANGTYDYAADPAVYGATGLRVAGTATERTEVRGTLALANLYWDLAERGTRFVPYIGAGVGFVVRSVDRRHVTDETLYDSTTVPPTDLGFRQISGQSKAHQVAPAAAAMLGVGYTLDNGMVLDFNYRFAYLGQVDFSTNIGGNASRLTIDDTFEHAIRAGVRWNVW